MEGIALVSMWDEIIDSASDALPKFNDYLLNVHRKEQINKCIGFMEMAFKEAIRLFNGEITYIGARVLTPEERINATLFDSKYPVNTVDVTRTELILVEFKFEYKKETCVTRLYLPYFIDNAILINGAKYYIQFALTDRVFYHITKENGIGIKVLRAHLRFTRNFRWPFISVNGIKYSDYIIILKAHNKSYSPTADDIRCALVLYPLSKFGWGHTLKQYGIKPHELQLVPTAIKDDPEFEYLEIRKSIKNGPGLYMKVSREIISTNPSTDIKTQMNCVSAIHYVLQYFVRYTKTIYTDNLQLIDLLLNDPLFTPWNIILGKTIYGINYQNELQAGGHALQHLESLDTYLDDYTNEKLKSIEVYCNNVYDLLDYVFINLDKYIVNYTPSNLYEKRVNINDLFYGNLVQSLFTRFYKKVNNKKGGKAITDMKDVEALFKMGSKGISKIYKCTQVVAGNPAVYNDSYLLTVGGRKCIATHSASPGGSKGDGKTSKSAGSQKANLMSSPVHRFHPSWAVVESILHISHQSPGIAGSINPFLQIDEKGNVIRPPYAEDIERLTPYLITK